MREAAVVSDHERPAEHGLGTSRKLPLVNLEALAEPLRVHHPAAALAVARGRVVVLVDQVGEQVAGEFFLGGHAVNAVSLSAWSSSARVIIRLQSWLVQRT